MHNYTIRLLDVNLENFKNVVSGSISMPSKFNNTLFTSSGDMLGIYGQNGTGKTAIIDALELIKDLLLGLAFDKNYQHYFTKSSTNASLSVLFLFYNDDERFQLRYTIEFLHVLNEGYKISQESICHADWNNEKEDFSKEKEILNFSLFNSTSYLSPQAVYDALISENEEHKINLQVAKKIVLRENVSSLFSSENLTIFSESKNPLIEKCFKAILLLQDYANNNLFIISNHRLGLRNLSFALPLEQKKNNTILSRTFVNLMIDSASPLTKEQFTHLKKLIENINLVLGKIVPNLSLILHNFAPKIDENTGKELMQVQLLSKREDIQIPLACESSGILKIISLLNLLICVHNEASMCLVVDELDAGIHEFLLGEILTAFEHYAQGQLIFTSHNLRPLEMLNKTSIIFSTANPQNRYIRLRNIKTNNNLRDVYIRSIQLGGQKEELYVETKHSNISRAFRKIARQSEECQNQK